VVRPRLLLFDEPLSNLDASLREQMRFQIRALQRRLQITALYVTHDQAEAMALSDRLVVMHRGRIAQAGTPIEVYRRPATPFVGGFLGRASFVPVTVVRDGAWAQARIGDTTYPASGPGTAASGPAVAMVRPEDLAVGRADEVVPDSVPALWGEVRRVTFLGAVTDYEVALETGATVTVHDVGARDVAVVERERVRVWPKGRTLYVLPGE
jgi:iron(III) transport system ATP-binding protein